MSNWSLNLLHRVNAIRLHAGVNSCDPSDENAEFLKEIKYHRALKGHLQFMDVSAAALCKQQSIPVPVFNLPEAGNISITIMGEQYVQSRNLAKRTGMHVHPSNAELSRNRAYKLDTKRTNTEQIHTQTILYQSMSQSRFYNISITVLQNLSSLHTWW